jgi:hypothetical protein
MMDGVDVVGEMDEVDGMHTVEQGSLLGLLAGSFSKQFGRQFAHEDWA